jgi:hypothetical protein
MLETVVIITLPDGTRIEERRITLPRPPALMGRVDRYPIMLKLI